MTMQILNPAKMRGPDHLKLMSIAVSLINKDTDKLLLKYEANLEIIGTSMCVFYQAGTCYRKCWGGGHVLESLIGWAYNLSCSAYMLTMRGFYDEALNLVRSMGEIGNLLTLCTVDETATTRWLESDKKTRLKDFSPSAIRRALKEYNVYLIASDSWYEEFCEKFTHVTPGTIPNHHNSIQMGYVGGVLQEDGLAKALHEIASVTVHIAVIVAKSFEFYDLLDELRLLTDNEK
jgi:hypothetical protein